MAYVGSNAWRHRIVGIDDSKRSTTDTTKSFGFLRKRPKYGSGLCYDLGR